MVSRAARLLGYRLHRDRSRTSCRPSAMGWLVLGLRPAGARGVRSDSKEVWEQSTRSRNVLRARRWWRRSDRNGGKRMKVLMGVDPHKTSVAVAVVEEALGELFERATFPQNLEKA